MSHTTPELLSPISDFETCLAAVHNGADAVYVGVPGWNARGRAPDLNPEEISQIIEYCHLRGVRVFFAMNVLVFERELRDLVPYLKELIALGPDAFIIQDPGLARLIKRIAPDQEIHASTQMTLSSPESVRLASTLGFNRFVLARELSLAEIAHVRSQVSEEIEVFVHGALCVSYSGQCLTSENFGGRSANRGQCAQSCRLPYKLLVDGKDQTPQGRPYLFSPQDLCTLDWIPKLMELGVHSLKIEGRLKSPEYVGSVTRAYRKVLDQGSSIALAPVTDESRAQLESLFSRGFFSGWLGGVDHQHLVSGKHSSHQGILLGKVMQVKSRSIEIQSNLQNPLTLVTGDGLVFVASENQEYGGRLYAFTDHGKGKLSLEFSNDFPYNAIKIGSEVWRNDSPSLEKEIRLTWTDRSRARVVPIVLSLRGSADSPLTLVLDDLQGQRVVVESDRILEMAQKPMEYPWISEELSSLTGTAYGAKSTHVQVSRGLFIQRKWIRELRQKAVTQLDQMRLSRFPSAKIHSVENSLVFPKGPLAVQDHSRSLKNQVALNVLVRRADQLDQLSPGLAIDTIFLDFDYGRPLGPSLERIQELGYRTGVATLRIHKSGEHKSIDAILKANPQVVLVRHLGALEQLRQHAKQVGLELVGDHSLNVCNTLTAEWLMEQGLQRLHPAWDLNRDQMLDLLHAFGGASFEVGLHQYVPTFHMEHCVFANTLSTGSVYPDCKVVCQKYHVEVEDHKGERHFLQSDAECRNTLYLGSPQSSVRLLDDLLQAGVQRFRMDVLQENAQNTAFKVQTYSDVLRKKITAEKAFQVLGITEQYGITQGQLFNSTRWQDRKKIAKGKV